MDFLEIRDDMLDVVTTLTPGKRDVPDWDSFVNEIGCLVVSYRCIPDVETWKYGGGLSEYLGVIAGQYMRGTERYFVYSKLSEKYEFPFDVVDVAGNKVEPGLREWERLVHLAFICLMNDFHKHPRSIDSWDTALITTNQITTNQLIGDIPSSD